MGKRTYATNGIKMARKRAGLSQEELGKRMPSDLTGSTVAKLETGRMALSLDYILEIADVLKIHPAYLVAPEDAGDVLPPMIEAPKLGEISDLLGEAHVLSREAKTKVERALRQLATIAKR